MDFACYIDESYDTRVFVLSCSTGPAAKWPLFDEAWSEAIGQINKDLERQGRTKITRYHATYCAGMSGEFRDWTVEEQINLTKTLISAMRRVPMHSVAYTVLLDDLREVWEKKIRIPITHEALHVGAYMLTAQFCLIELGQLMFGLNPEARIALIHDHSDYDDVLQNAFNYLKHKAAPPFASVFSSIRPESSVGCPPLQLADFLAYEFFRDRRDEEFKGESYARRKSLTAALQTGTGVRLSTINKSGIEEIMHFNGFGRLPNVQS